MLAWNILPIVALLNFAVGFTVLRRDFRALVNWLFVAFAWSVGLWVAVDYLLMESWSQQSAILFETLAHLMGVFIAATLWLFSRSFIQHKGMVLKKEWALVGVPTFLMSAYTLWPGALAKTAVLHPWGPEVFIQPAYHITFTIFFAIFFFHGLYTLARYVRHGTKRMACHQAQCLTRGIVFAAVGGIFFDIILISPFIQQQQFTWVGPIFTIGIIFGTWWARKWYFFGIPMAANVAVHMDDDLAPLRWLIKLFKSVKHTMRRSSRAIVSPPI